MDELSGSGSGIEDESMGNLGYRRKRRRTSVTCVTYSYESDPEFDDYFEMNESEVRHETWIPSDSDVEEVDSYSLLSDELAIDIDNIQNQSTGEYFCDHITDHNFLF